MCSSSKHRCAPEIPVVPVDCATSYGHRDNLCGNVEILAPIPPGGVPPGGLDPRVPSVELDWLTFFWDVTTNPMITSGGEAITLSVTELLVAYRNALAVAEGTQIGDVRVTFEAWRIRILEQLGAEDDDFIFAALNAKALTHSVHDPDL